jgi:hypothetical protein
MAVEILGGKLDGRQSAAVLVDSVTFRPFGPVFCDEGEAEEFFDYLAHHRSGRDPRSFTVDELETLLDAMRGDA